MRQHLCLATLAAAAALTVAAAPAHATGNTSAPSDWRFTPGQLFNGVAALDAVARLSFTASDGYSYGCSGSLLAGGAYVLTAAHCADDFVGSMTVQFGWAGGSATVTRTVSTADATVHPLWQGFDNSVDRGVDLAVLRLSAPVTTLAGYTLSTTNDVGKEHLMAGYGTTQVGSVNAPTNWNDGSFGHYAFNTFDVTSRDFNKAVDQVDPTWGFSEAYYAPGVTYMVDFDHPNGNAANNTLQRVANATGNTWASSAGLGLREGVIAGGDSGGPDLVWNGTEWLLSGVHSWGWGGNSVCSFINVGPNNCDVASDNGSSYGDLSGSTAVFSAAGWINAVTAVPEPQTWALLLAGLAGVSAAARRRRA
jgi:hypothetical protein